MISFILVIVRKLLLCDNFVTPDRRVLLLRLCASSTRSLWGVLKDNFFRTLVIDDDFGSDPLHCQFISLFEQGRLGHCFVLYVAFLHHGGLNVDFAGLTSIQATSADPPRTFLASWLDNSARRGRFFAHSWLDILLFTDQVCNVSLTLSVKILAFSHHLIYIFRDISRKATRIALTVLVKLLDLAELVIMILFAPSWLSIGCLHTLDRQVCICLI